MNSAILITARLKSTRLKKKVLKEIVDKPMLAHLVERLRLAKKPERIILCTSTVEQDDPLALFAEKEGIDYFRGHPDDVLLRMKMAAEKFNVDTVISCTADNPFVDPIYIDKLLEFHLSNGYDFTRSEGLPFGTFAYALQTDAIIKACEMKDEVDTEVWGGYFTQTGVFKCGVMSVLDPEVRWPDLRLTVDTQEDFNLISEIFSRLYKLGQVFSLKEIVSLCQKTPELLAMNSEVQQKPSLPIKLK